MKYKFIAVLIVPLLVMICVQTMLIVELRGRMEQLDLRITRSAAAQTMIQNLPALTLPRKDCQPAFSGLHIESY